jgi:alkylation response protein AidB-like acyl-CoA dehydrogenase
MIASGIYEHEHQQFRESFRHFLDRDVVPHHETWEADGIMPRAIFEAAGRHGFLGMSVPVEHGGAGVDDFRFNAVIGDEVQRAGVRSFGSGITLHNDICLPYFLSYATSEQAARWLPAIASGEAITAIAMTEPGAGSDLAGIRTRAQRDGDVYRVSGAKTFITNGQNADLVITAVRTGESRHGGLTLVVIERGMEGFCRGRNLQKIGLHAQDTAELFFDDVRVPIENVLGGEGQGFEQLVTNLPQERLSIAIAAVAASRAAFDWTLAYVKERQAFGQPIGVFQANRFSLAELHTEITLGELLVERCISALLEQNLTPEDAAMAKYWCTDLQGRVVDCCVQLHGGYGYMTEYPIARAYADARISRIYGGANEIMKEVIGGSLGLR